MKKTVLSTLIALSTLALGGAAAAQGMNPYSATGINNGNNGYQHSNHMRYQDPNAGQFNKYRYTPIVERSVKYHIGIDAHKEKYSEKVGGAKYMQEKGKLYGIVAGVDIPVGQKGTLALEGIYTKGKSKYTGSYMGGEYGSVTASKLDRKMYKVSGTYKYQFQSLYNTTWGAGVDYRYLKDNLDQAGPGGYVRENKTLWAHLTVEKDFSLNKAWTFTPQLKGSYLLKGTQKAGIGSGLEFKQNKGYGYELGLGFTRDFGKYDLTLKPYYRITDIKDSKPSQGFYEPRNKTQEAGVQLVFTF